MDYVEQNDYIINCAYDSVGREKMKRFFFADFIDITTSIIDCAEKEVGGKLDDEYKKFLSYFYTEALVGMLIEWIKNRDERNKKQVTDYLVRTIKDSLTGIMGTNNLRKC